MILRLALGLSALALSLTAVAAKVEVPATTFALGGWGLDCQFMDVMGSPYLIAHGLGERVLDATAVVMVPETAEYRVWVRTRNWAEGAPGKFKVSVDGRVLDHVFGTGASTWEWEDGGTVMLKSGEVRIALQDMTGFDGRCAGIVLAFAGERPEGALTLGENGVEEQVQADFVVVGGGLPGTCAAVAAARRGLKTVLVQDRPVLGGNASSEIRVWCAGEMRYELVRELRGIFMNRDVNTALGDAHRMRLVQDETNLIVRLSTRAYGVERMADGRIASVKALDMKANRRVIFKAPLFCDATGDGWVGYWAGADWRMGREAKDEHDESFAPDQADRDTLGASIMWTSVEANVPKSFSAPWAEAAAQGEMAVNGEWNWEYGIHRDMIAEGEQIRDRLLLAIYGAFSRAKKLPENANRVLNFCPYLLGKRESRRILGDWIYSQQDVTERRLFEDAIATGSWSLDLHYDDFKPGVDFLTSCRQPHYGRYWIPYRSIYSRNVNNLFVVGRCFSCTHVGLSGPRVVCTLAQLGVAAGEAAAICTERGIKPRQVYANGHIRELQDRLGGDWPGRPDPRYRNWRIVDDETEGVTFGEGWDYSWCPNGGQVGDRSHFIAGCVWGCETQKVDYSKVGEAVYPLSVEKAGRYELYGRIPYCWWAKPGSRTRLEVVSDGKTVCLDWDQGLETGTWRRIGVVELVPGAVLKIVPAKSSGTVVADGFAICPE